MRSTAHVSALVLTITSGLQPLTSATIDQQVLIDKSNKPGITFSLYLLEAKVVTGLVNVTHHSHAFTCTSELR